MRKTVLFIDRDGTLVEEPSDFQVDRLEKVRYLPGVFTYLGRISRELNYELVMVTNQDGLGTEDFPEEDFRVPHEFIIDAFLREGITFSGIFVDRTYAHEHAPTRKPGTAMLSDYMNGDYDLSSSFVIGDRLTDIKLAQNLGARGILIGGNLDLGASELGEEREWVTDEIALRATNWADIHRFLSSSYRSVHHNRTTRETEVDIFLNLDGKGEGKIETGIGFFDHMLEQLMRHGRIDLDIRVKGDLHIDEHHTIEDTGIALGEAFDRALADKRGIERYGFSIPMDDSHARVSIDFGGRSQLVWKADFQREYIGEMPVEMFPHFFKSFCDGARANLYVQVEGENEHHKIESVFKGFARSIRAAVARDTRYLELPTTKGSL